MYSVSHVCLLFSFISHENPFYSLRSRMVRFVWVMILAMETYLTVSHTPSMMEAGIRYNSS